MKFLKSALFISFTILILFSNCARLLRKGPEYIAKKEQKLQTEALLQANRCIDENMSADSAGPIPIHTKVDSISLYLSKLQLNIYLSKYFSYQPFREEGVESIYALFREYLGKKFDDFNLILFTLDHPIENLIPNFYRADTSRYDDLRMPKAGIQNPPPILYPLYRENRLPQQGLFNRHIVIRPSHGFYYSNEKDRWEWQRPRLFNTVEDLFPMSFVIPYLAPMLENAGAVVFLSRERDVQTHEVIVDNDSTSAGEYRETDSQMWQNGYIPGFAIGDPPYPVNYNPFEHGSFRYCLADTAESAGIEWIPDIPETGEYSVQISYSASDQNVIDAHYTVFHSGGKTDVLINQQIGGNTWLYLGRFTFEKGFNPETGKVVLNNKSREPGKIVSADAVRFGGGMGNIKRGGKVSGYPRFAEGSRYYLQYAGMPDTLVYNFHGDSIDYNDDYKSRAEFVNYLRGRPFGPNENRDADGLGIPIDLTLSFHTDAGIGDSTIGTLMIYSIPDVDTSVFFPDGMSRLANRDMADILQTEIVEDVRLKYNQDWSRRALMNGNYAEARRPNVPSCLLELLSHQNFIDMQYGLSPQFRFDVSRSLYKGMLKFLSAQYRTDYVVQPLPVSHFSTFFSDSAEVTLHWRQVEDPLEPSAQPQKYVVYTRIENEGFDNGALIDSTNYTLGNLENGLIYSFKVTAVNAGGESFPSEILSVCWIDGARQPVLIVNGFDRISAPAFINEPNFKGFANFLDAGVPDRYDFNFTGSQFDYFANSAYQSNDAPGHGASYANFETEIISGNSFDIPFIHGSAIRNYGTSFISASDEALMDSCRDFSKIRIMDLILGEEKATLFPEMQNEYNPHKKLNDDYRAFPEKLKTYLNAFCEAGGCLFVSGAYVGSDLHSSFNIADKLFAEKTLRFRWQTDHAAATGGVFTTDSTFSLKLPQFQFNTSASSELYPVESPDAIDPLPEAKTILRYAENRFSAGISYSGAYQLIVFGFPFESIIKESWRDRMMSAILNYFSAEKAGKLTTN